MILKTVTGNYPRPGRGRGVTNGVRADPWLWAVPVGRRVLGSYLAGQRYWDGLSVKRTYKSIG